MKFMYVILFTLFSISALAAVTCPPDIVFDSEIQIEVGPSDIVDLKLNGTGLRKVFFVKVFFGALYLENLSSDETSIIDSDEVKVLTIHALRNLPEQHLKEEWDREFKRLCNNQCRELVRFHKQFLSYTRDANKGERLTTVFLKDRVELITEDGSYYEPIRSRAYRDLLLRSLIGPRPSSKKFKKSVLGRGKKVCS